MAGRNPNEAFTNYIEPLREVLGCVTESRLILRGRRRLRVGPVYTVSLSTNDPVVLKGPTPVALTVGQLVQIERIEDGDPRGPYQIRTAEYMYALSALDGSELLAFHWTPEHPDANARTFPHMHVGRALLGGQEAARSGEFHKVHIPSGGRVSIEAIIRMLLDDFMVTPLRTDWRDILAQTETSLQQ